MPALSAALGNDTNANVRLSVVSALGQIGTDPKEAVPALIAAQYHRALALYRADVAAWVQEAQPNAWETLDGNHGAQAGNVLLARLREQINTRGTLDVLRHDIEMIGLKQKLLLAQFKPALAMNPEILAR